MKTQRSLAALALATAIFCGTTALAQTGVGDDRVSLPDGPGSRDGLGDNASVNPNMGQMSTSVNIDVPAGFAGVTPSVGLSYSSGAGNSVVGLGWSMGVPFIERMTSRGYPEYTDSDRFVANGSDQLVRVSAPGAEPAVYRARFEGGFVRYTWFERGNGDEGYWTAEYPDGLVATFGAEPNGDAIPESRVGTDNGTFRYLITSMVDRFGHEMRYDYQVYGTTSLLDQISYVFTTASPRYRVSFEYEQRDDIQSDASGGFLEEIADRLASVDVFSGNTRISRYVLDYEDYAAAGGASRLQRVRRFGKDGGLFPVVQSFEYSKALGGVCEDNSDARNCQAPYLVDMGELGVSIQSRTANLIDLNGDSLPDIVDTATSGAPMRIFLNSLSTDGTQDFIEKAGGSAVLRNVSGFELNSSKVQMLDVDGDGFVDLVNQQLGRVLKNKGAGDWDSVESLAPVVADSIPDFGDFNASQDGDLSNVRFLDANGDRRIDVLRTSPARTEIFLNDGTGGYQILAGVELMGSDGFGTGWDFATTENLELADMNGDGLLDPVRILSGRLDYQLNLGFGRWSPIQSVTGLPFTVENDAQEVGALELEDINGDGLDDVVVVLGSTVRFAINRNGATFDAVTTIEGVGNQSLPARVDTTTVLYADMNGNGSNDIVWITASGGVTFLELFPVRPNLLTKIENGLGLVTEVTYGTAAEQRANATDPATQWPDPIPTQMLVVTSMEIYAQSSDPTAVQHHVTKYAYQAGFYNGVEKQFAGFSRVDTTSEGDEDEPSSHTALTYDTGAGVDRAQMAGRLLRRATDDADGPQQVVSNEYALCPVDDLPTQGLDFPIRFVCQTSSESVMQNGATPDAWATTRSEYGYDGYGNQTLYANLGVIRMGDGACEPCARDASVFGQPCGAQCVGDEVYLTTSYVPPSAVTDAYMTGLAFESTRYGRPDSDVVATIRTQYDGAQPFVGLSLGSARLGLVTQVTEQREIGGDFETVARNRYDVHGNVVEAVSERGANVGEAFHTFLTYDEDHLDLTSDSRGVASPDGDYRLKQVFDYEPLFGKPARGTPWFIEGAAPAEDTSTNWTYDEFGRLLSVIKPGDTVAAPTLEYQRDYGSPSTRIQIKARSVSGSAADLEMTECRDGFGRLTASITRVDDTRFLVTGSTEYGRLGRETRTFDAYEKSDDACATPPAGTLSNELQYDGQGREIDSQKPDQGIYGGSPSRRTLRHLPLQTVVSDEDDNDASSDSRATPVVMQTDGLGRAVSITRSLTAGGPVQTYAVTYDELGNIRGYRDPAGNEKIQTYNLRGEVLTIFDPDRGTTTFSYDAAGNVVRKVDAEGRAVVTEYDSLNRRTAEYEEANPDTTRVEWFYDRSPDCAASTCRNGAANIVSIRYPLADRGVGIDRIDRDSRLRVVSVRRSVDGKDFEFQSFYDNADRVIESVYPGDQHLRYRFDGMGRTVSIDGYVDSIAYDERGLLSDVTYSNGTSAVRRYDEVERLKTLETRDRGGNPLVAMDLTRDRRGNVTAIVDRATGEAGAQNRIFEYDALGRLVNVQMGAPGEQNFESSTYEYSSLEDIVSKISSRETASTDHVGNYRYDGAKPHTVVQAGGEAIGHDASGAMVVHGARSFEYDHLQQLTHTYRGTELMARNYYDASGLRVLSLDQDSSTYELTSDFEVRDGVTRLMVAVGGKKTVEIQSDALLAELVPDLVADGIVNAADAFAAGLATGGDTGEGDIDGVLRGSARRLLLGAGGSHTAWLALDQLGSTVAVTDSTGAVTERIQYQAFGSVRDASAGRTEYARFAGTSLDQATNLFYFKSRFYDPVLGRFLSPDREYLAFKSSGIALLTDAVAAYTYCGNNPVNGVDSNGRTHVDIDKPGEAKEGAVSVLSVGLQFGAYAAVGALEGFLTFGLANTIGAIAGGAIAFSLALAEASFLARAATEDGVSLKPGDYAFLVGKVLGRTAVGAGKGFVSGGWSIPGEAIGGIVKLRSAQLKLERQSPAYQDRNDAGGSILLTAEAGGVLGLLFAIGDPAEAIGDLTAEAIIVGIDAAVELGKVPYKEAKRMKANKENANRPDLQRPSPYIPKKLSKMFRKK